MPSVSVGAGSAGSVIASRLSEDKASSVLILEAGGWDLGNHLLDIPGYTDKIVLTHMDWQYFTVPQKYSAFAMEDNVSCQQYKTIFYFKNGRYRHKFMVLCQHVEQELLTLTGHLVPPPVFSCVPVVFVDHLL